jgi:uncharacterized protein YkwD
MHTFPPRLFLFDLLLSVVLFALPMPLGAAPAAALAIERWTNALRSSRGLGPVRLDPALCRAAAAHAAEMARNHYCGHAGAGGRWFGGGSSPGSRAWQAGYAWSFIVENIAAGRPTPATAFAAWVASRPHYRNLVEAVVRDLGVGVAYDPQGRRLYWVMELAQPHPGALSPFVRGGFGVARPFGFGWDF